MATVATPPMTAAEFAALDLDVPVELVRGEVLEMPRPVMRHGVICKNVSFLLEQWVRNTNAPYLVVVEAGIVTERDPDTVRGPNLYVIARSRLSAEGVTPGFLDVPPDVCVAVFSPSDVWKDVITKVDEYLQAGVREVWVIEPDERRAYVYRPDAPPRTIGDGDAIVSAALAELTVPMHELFRDVPAN